MTASSAPPPPRSLRAARRGDRPLRPPVARPGADDPAAEGRGVPALRERARADLTELVILWSRELGPGLRVGPPCAAGARRRAGRGRHGRSARRRHLHRSRRCPRRVAIVSELEYRRGVPTRRSTRHCARSATRSRRADRHGRLLHDAGDDHERRPHAAPDDYHACQRRHVHVSAPSFFCTRWAPTPVLGPGARQRVPRDGWCSTCSGTGRHRRDRGAGMMPSRRSPTARGTGRARTPGGDVAGRPRGAAVGRRPADLVASVVLSTPCLCIPTRSSRFGASGPSRQGQRLASLVEPMDEMWFPRSWPRRRPAVEQARRTFAATARGLRAHMRALAAVDLRDRVAHSRCPRWWSAGTTPRRSATARRGWPRRPATARCTGCRADAAPSRTRNGSPSCWWYHRGVAASLDARSSRISRAATCSSVRRSFRVWPAAPRPCAGGCGPCARAVAGARQRRHGSRSGTTPPASPATATPRRRRRPAARVRARRTGAQFRVAHEQDLQADVAMVHHDGAPGRSRPRGSARRPSPRPASCGTRHACMRPADRGGHSGLGQHASSASSTERFHSPIRPSHTTVELSVSG